MEKKYYNVVIDGRLIISDLKTYDNIRKIKTGQGDDCITGYLLDHQYFKKYYKLIAIDPKAIQQINFTGNLNRGEGARMYFITEEAKETVLDFV